MKTPAELFSLKGKVAVVIGGTGVLCGEMAEGLAIAGATVALVGRDAAKAKARLDKIAKGGGKAEFFSCDTTSKAGLQQLLADVLKKFGRVDILVNGAGVNSPTPFFDIPEDEIRPHPHREFERTHAVVPGFWQAHGRAKIRQHHQSRLGFGTHAVVARVHLLGVEGGGAQLVQKSRARMGDCRRAREHSGARIFSRRNRTAKCSIPNAWRKSWARRR